MKYAVYGALLVCTQTIEFLLTYVAMTISQLSGKTNNESQWLVRFINDIVDLVIEYEGVIEPHTKVLN